MNVPETNTEADQSLMILISIGANQATPDGASPLDTCRCAVGALASLAGFRLSALSRWYKTAPLPPSCQQQYVNAVARLSVVPGHSIDPARLLSDLMGIEGKLGRVRGGRNSARTIDLDIIAIENLVRTAPDPILPHPRAHERAFVMVPMLEVASGWVHPVLGQSLDILLVGLSSQEIRVL